MDDRPNESSPVQDFPQPVTASSPLGLLGLATATLVAVAHPAGWYGDSKTPAHLFPFVTAYTASALLLKGICGRALLLPDGKP